MIRRVGWLIVVALVLSLLLAGCTPGHVRFGGGGDNGAAGAGGSPAGFWWGIWHGWIAPFSLVLGFFRANVRVYEVRNIGWWYDLGFYMAIVGGFGGIALTRRKKDHK